MVRSERSKGMRIIGRNALQHYVLYLDYNDGLLFIKPNL